MLSRHYSPATPTLLTADVKALAHTYAGKKIGLLLFTHAAAVAGVAYTEVLSASGDLNEAARNLYAALHRLDKQGLDLIIAECFPHSGLGNTINDRLQRAVQPE
jgi:L-threonylcarbamoyladenylate synthase